MHPDAASTTEATPTLAVIDVLDLGRRAAAYARRTTSEGTRKAYARDWRKFEGWCQASHLQPFPAAPATVGLFLAGMAGHFSVATLGRCLAAISTMHRLSGAHLDIRHPAIHDVLRGIRREHGALQRRVAPATTAVVKAMAASCDASLLGARDRALVLIGFAAALRRSEIVALDVDDVAVVGEGVRITIRRSKTDQDSIGATVGVVRAGTSTCPVAALQDWLSRAEIKEGRVFRRVDRHGRIGTALTGQSVALMMKKRAKLVGLDPADFSGHSLRAGLATAAATNEVEERIIQRQTRHRSLTVLRTYIRDGEMFLQNASGRVGL
ncbi:MAG: hypothetical protein BGP12_17600 [Rhodospirillales bacterium 70-18]|nr:MAG: hypothetical protein BGP12_17600 [Rhodospirillales bacterium 70-18]